MDVILGKSQKKIIQKVANKQQISLKDAEAAYIAFFRELKNKMILFDKSNPEETECNVRLKYFGVFHNSVKENMKEDLKKQNKWKKKEEK